MPLTVDLRDDFPCVRDQGSRPTCLAFALSDTHSAVRAKSAHHSAEFLYFHGVQRMPTKDPSAGLSFLAATDALQKTGQPSENQWPYLTSLPKDLSQWKPPVVSQTSHALASTSMPTIALVRQSLNQGQPVVLGIQISHSFIHVNDKGELATLAVDKNAGNHAVVAVGHGTTTDGYQAILIRNSWGTDWGDNGHAWLPDLYLAPRLFKLSVLTLLP